MIRFKRAAAAHWADYKKTDLRKSVELMEKTLLDPLALAHRRKLRAEREREFLDIQWEVWNDQWDFSPLRMYFVLLFLM